MKQSKVILNLLLLFTTILGAIFNIVFTASVSAGPLEYYYQKEQHKKEDSLGFASKIILNNIHEIYFDQIKDHNNPELGTFKQRYYLDNSFAISNDSPIFFYICGESTCSSRYLTGQIREIAKQFNARLVALEHRYYGNSYPVPDLSTPNLKYLSTEQALKDLENFQTSITSKHNWTGKWVSFGGSYPGSLSAYYRLKYPNLVVGAIASSAPVMADEDFYLYDTHVAEVAGPSCLDNIKQAVDIVESAINNNSDIELNNIKNLFLAIDVKDNTDFLYLLADVAAFAVQYGDKNTFCEQLENKDNNKSVLENYADYTKNLYNRLGTDAAGFTAQGALDITIKSEDDGNNNMRQWFYQSCTEYGYWQTANPDMSKSSRSNSIDLDYHKKLCQRLFNTEYNLDTNKINTEFYYPLFGSSVTNIYFTNGSTDPWSNLSLSDRMGNAINPNLHYYTIYGAAHCDDLRASKVTDSMSLVGARQKMAWLIARWLG